MIFAFFVALTSQSVEVPPSWRNPPDCWNGAQSELTHCAWEEYRQADAKMNEQWERTVAVVRRLDEELSLDPDYPENAQFESLLAAQRAWLEFRDHSCARYSSMRRGSMIPMLQGICLRDLTVQRTEQLYQLTRSDVRDGPIYPDMEE